MSVTRRILGRCETGILIPSLRASILNRHAAAEECHQRTKPAEQKPQRPRSVVNSACGTTRACSLRTLRLCHKCFLQFRLCQLEFCRKIANESDRPAFWMTHGMECRPPFALACQANSQKARPVRRSRRAETCAAKHGIGPQKKPVGYKHRQRCEDPDVDEGTSVSQRKTVTTHVAWGVRQPPSDVSADSWECRPTRRIFRIFKRQLRKSNLSESRAN